MHGSNKGVGGRAPLPGHTPLSHTGPHPDPTLGCSFCTGHVGTRENPEPERTVWTWLSRPRKRSPDLRAPAQPPVPPSHVASESFSSDEFSSAPARGSVFPRSPETEAPRELASMSSACVS